MWTWVRAMGMSAAVLVASQAVAAPVCGMGTHRYWAWVCLPDGTWSFEVVGIEEFSGLRSLYLDGVRSNCFESERDVGGGGDDPGQCWYSTFDFLPTPTDCLPPDKSEVCEPVPPEEEEPPVMDPVPPKLPPIDVPPGELDPRR